MLILIHSFNRFIFARLSVKCEISLRGITDSRTKKDSPIMKTILAFGNPLLDITISSKNQVLQLIQKYNLKIDGQKEISKSDMNLLSKDIEG